MRGTPGQRGGWKAHDPSMFCSCTPEMYEPPMYAFSPHVSRGYADQQNSQPVTSDQCVDESQVLRPRVHPDSSPTGDAAASVEAHREPLVCVWRHPYPGCLNPSHSSCRCSFSFNVISGTSSVIRVLLSAPWCLQLRHPSLVTC